LQENKYRKLGGQEELPVNCRIISSTNVVPDKCVAEALIRKDLYYRLAVISFTIPPLRERREDIPVLTRHFIRFFSMKYGKPVISISKELEAAFIKYDWPGNVRELEHIIEASVTMLDTENTIMPEHLPIDLKSLPAPVNEAEKKLLSEALLEAEESAIFNVLEEYRWKN
jgi:arginine utilization regulatory protein